MRARLSASAQPYKWPLRTAGAARKWSTATPTGARRSSARRPTTLTIRDLRIDHGQAFTSADVDSAAKVALLGKTVIDNLFGGEDPVGKMIRIKSVPFTVVGTLVPKGQSPTGQDQDDIILMPISTAKKKVIGSSQANSAAVGAIMVQAREGATYDAQDQMTRCCASATTFKPIRTTTSPSATWRKCSRRRRTRRSVMAILLAAIASVSLIVGGIGIMNIMLVSVTERTKEIGLRQAVGAKTKDILTQFLVEAVTLSIAGGAIGIVLGVSASLLISYFAQWSTQFSVGSIALAFFFSALVGVTFGYYPARKAAYLDPIEALHYE